MVFITVLCFALLCIGMPTNPVELNRVALVLDPDRIGIYNIDRVLDLLRPEKVKPMKEPKTDAEKIAVEVCRVISSSFISTHGSYTRTCYSYSYRLCSISASIPNAGCSTL